MTALDYALQVAAEGGFVFPCRPGGKQPLPGLNWREQSTTDPGRIRAWAVEVPGCNFALDCGRSERLVVDVDVHDGKPGYESLAALEAEHGKLPTTFRVGSPSGGEHIHFVGQARTTASTALGRGIDTRGQGGYVLLPGSVVDGKPYVVKEDRPPAALPAWLAAKLDAPKAAAGVPAGLDRPETMTDAEVLARARARHGDSFSVLYDEGDTVAQDGDHSAADFALLCMLARFSRNAEQLERIFEESALTRPKWEDRPDYRSRSIAAALRETYGETAEGMFGLVEGCEARAQAQGSLYDRAPLRASDLCLVPPKPREFIFDGEGGLSRNIVGVMAATGGFGKTSLAIQKAVSVSSGVDCLGGAFKFRVRGPVLAVLAEDDSDEIARRLWRIQQEVGPIDLSDLHILPRGGDPRLVVRDRGGSLQPTRGFDKLLSLIQELEPVLVFVDSLSVTAGEAEVSNPDGAFAASLLGQLCEPSKAAVMALAHVSKASQATKAHAGKKATPEQALDQALDPMAVRGASSIVNNTRWCMTGTSVPRSLNRKLGVAEGTHALAYAVRKTNYSARMEIAYLENDAGFLRPLETVHADPAKTLLMFIELQGPVSRRELSEGQLREQIGLSRAAIRGCVARLIEEGLVEETMDGRKTILTATGGCLC